MTEWGTVGGPNLTTFNYVAVTLDGTGTIAVSQWQTLTNGSLEITGGDYAPAVGAANSANSFTNLGNINGSSLYVSGGREPEPARCDFVHGQ